MDDLERISKKLGTIDILKSQKEKVESMSNINPDPLPRKCNNIPPPTN